MGCGSSKPKSRSKSKSKQDEIDETVCKDAYECYQVEPPFEASRTARSSARSKKSEKSTKSNQSHGTNQTKTDSRVDNSGANSSSDPKVQFENVVMAALQQKLKFATIQDIETFVSQHTRSTVDQYNRRMIIQRIVSNGFANGCLVVRTIKGNCL